MGNSLSTQLLQAGLVNKKQINKAKQEKHKEKKKHGSKDGVVSESQQLAQKALAAEKEQVRQLNRERQLQIAQKEIVAQINQMVMSSRVKVGNGEIVFNFVDNNKIKKIRVTREMRDLLSKGQMAIVKNQEQYEVVPAEVARKIANRNPAVVLVLNESRQIPAEDDPYAEFPIPDDLDW